ncbi:UPF0223 family protein [Evansella cellulosilytica]|uniref:Uncharacterized protein n=1 Tax=Evansella cellulosilytica (strain ATCC 21833 / DSM 2522 / FERM P-1141 / JCM 9156 / N-4) TaxID=649639 RepID=E6TUM2_EVAC2|nr:UPF0223 family protein [Evansella cellulosilytica]ADU30912.1 protein of unknown function UPF0223 [Evansella cellulosilytica DSM 2522]
MKDDVIIPISMDWSKEEIIDVVNFYEGVDKAYKKGIDRELMLVLYHHFKKVVRSKGEEKGYFKDYEEQTDQSPYHVMKLAREAKDQKVIKM